MSQRIAGMSLWAAAIAAAFLLSGTAAGQSAQANNASKPWTLPRTPDGQPDLQGVWTTLASPICEYAYTEGNYAVLGLLGGSRSDERKDEKKRGTK